MARYVFYPSADRRQDEIWDYTLRTWGEAQAEKYIHGLHAHLQKTAERKTPWRPLPKHLANPVGVTHQAYVTRYEKHYLFFRELPGGAIGVMAILHEAMDMPVRLR